jgi:hypothetical protein
LLTTKRTHEKYSTNCMFTTLLMKDHKSPDGKVRDLSFKMDLLAFPEEIVALIFEQVGNFRYYKPSRECVLNVMLANKLCYSIGLPILYRDVKLEHCYRDLACTYPWFGKLPDYRAILSFFRALPDHGRYVRRLYLNGICNGTSQHILSVDQLKAIARYCRGLRVFVLTYAYECSCDTIQGPAFKTIFSNNLKSWKSGPRATGVQKSHSNISSRFVLVGDTNYHQDSYERFYERLCLGALSLLRCTSRKSGR